MKRIIFFIALTTSVTVYGQNLGLGVRLGDPSGLSLKKYFGDKAFEISFGRTYMFNDRYWYVHHFNDWYEEHKFDYNEIQYIGYKASVPLGIQMHYLFQKGFNKIEDEDLAGLKWYFGFGGQLRFQNYSYDFRYKLKGDPDWHYDENHQVREFDFGGDGVIGLEYTFKNAPISIFADVVLFMEIIDNPFLFYGQGGIGCRYNF